MFVTYNWAIANTGSVVPLGAFYIDIQQINKFAVVMKSKSDIRGEDADADAGAGARVGGEKVLLCVVCMDNSTISPLASMIPPPYNDIPLIL